MTRDPTTGDASTSAANDMSYTVDSLGEDLTMTDHNGSTHTYAMDTLGRETGDAVGNQTAVSTDGTPVSNASNSQNELTGVGAATLGYDDNGNTTTDQSGQRYVYNAWDEIVAAKNSSGTTIETFAYDALGRRTAQNPGTAIDLYYSTAGQVLETRTGSIVTSQNVWGLDYVNDLVLRDDNSTAGDLGISGSGLGQRLYAQHDANFDVTALTDSTGTVVERYTYDPYGNVTVLNPDCTIRGDGTLASSEYGVPNLFQGMRYDSVTGLYASETRDLNPVTGTWLQADPAGYVNGSDLYQFALSDPLGRVDPGGTQSAPIPDRSFFGISKSDIDFEYGYLRYSDGCPVPPPPHLIPNDVFWPFAGPIFICVNANGVAGVGGGINLTLLMDANNTAITFTPTSRVGVDVSAGISLGAYTSNGANPFSLNTVSPTSGNGVSLSDLSYDVSGGYGVASADWAPPIFGQAQAFSVGAGPGKWEVGASAGAGPTITLGSWHSFATPLPPPAKCPAPTSTPAARPAATPQPGPPPSPTPPPGSGAYPRLRGLNEIRAIFGLKSGDDRRF